MPRAHNPLFIQRCVHVPGARTRFPHFNGFHPKFSAGTSPSPLPSQPIYTIFWKSFIRFRFSISPSCTAVGLACIRYCQVCTAPFATTDDARWVKRVDREELALKKKFIKHRGIRKIRVEPRERNIETPGAGPCVTRVAFFSSSF